ncbi:MAG: tRNA threonylcarbamoyladenosine dehydratase [Burkholderiales bacterium]|nr:tRNA threonylcarbamoyladenosine dehydratase [Burkholderiales bacterium]
MESLDERRFGGIARLYGESGFARIRAAHVVVVGVGGVGSWAAEALARSGVARLSLIDLDVVAPSNLNRQAQATLATLGGNKVDAMAERIHAFAPDCSVSPIDDFITPTNVASLLPPDATFVIDAIDQVPAKAALINHCHARTLPLVVCGGAGGKTDGSRLTINDLAQTTHDALLAKVRTLLRRDYAFPRDGKRFGVVAVHSTEATAAVARDGGAGLACAGYGSAMHITAGMGLLAAGHVLHQLAAR